MRTIHKHRLSVHGHHIRYHAGGEVVLVAEQAGRPTLWLEVDTDKPKRGRFVFVVGTGQELPCVINKHTGEKERLDVVHIGSYVATDGFVWHFYW